MAKHCIWPGCGKELPEDEKGPLCEHHKDELGDKAKKGILAGITAGGGLFAVAKNGGFEFIKKNVPQASRAAKEIVSIMLKRR